MPQAQETFGQALRRLRRARGLSLRRLDELSGLSYSYLSMLEVGVRMPARETIGRLAQALQLTGEQTSHLYLTMQALPPGDWLVREDGALIPV